MNKQQIESVEISKPVTGTQPPPRDNGGPRSWGLSAKLLVLTVAFVMIAEILIFVPSVANFRNVWLRNHLHMAESASIVYLDADELMLSESAGSRLLETTQSLTVAIRRGGISQMMASSPNTGIIAEHINIDDSGVLSSIQSALSMLIMEPDLQYRVFGRMRSGDGVIELVQELRHIQRAMLVYSRNVLVLSLFISVFTAALVYLALYRMIVRPIIRISANMDEFSKSPENASLIFRPGHRTDEIGIAEKRLSAFQQDLQYTLRQKQRLADLGLAVSKINHDLRNILASAQLFSDRLTGLPDPTVQRFAPKLIRTIDRAVAYTKSVIDYGRALEAPPNRKILALRGVVTDVSELLGLETDPNVEWANEVAPDLQIDADPEQLFRILMNLCRNSQQAVAELEPGGSRIRIAVTAERIGRAVHVRVIDTGPGIPDHVREKLFDAFQGSTKTDGSGLGMSIAAELIRAHGGLIQIDETSEEGTTFCLTVPDRPDQQSGLLQKS